MATDRLVKVTNDKGEETIERVPEGTVDDLRKVGADVEDPKTGQKNQGRPVYEANFPEAGKADAVNVAKEIAKTLKDALREHGDELQGMFLKNMSTRGVTVKVTYKPDEQGQQTEDEFVFRWDNGSIRLDNVGQPVDLGQIQNRSGRSTIQKDLLKDKLLAFLTGHDESEATPSDPAAMPEGPQVNENENLWESEECQNAFCDAVTAYRADSKNKEAIKNLFKACRPFQKGNTIQEKLKGAVDWYNWFTENPPKNTKKQVFLEEASLNSITEARDKIQEALDILHNLDDYSKRVGTWMEDLGNVLIDINRVTNGGEELDEFDDCEEDPLDEFMDLNDPVARGEKDARPVGQDISPKDRKKMKHFWDYWEKDDKPVCEEDEFGPEVGDEVEYGEGHYKLYGYCGYEVVLQNVDDERDFKLVKPADIGMDQKPPLSETEYVDPEQLPDEEENPLENPEYVR